MLQEVCKEKAYKRNFVCVMKLAIICIQKNSPNSEATKLLSMVVGQSLELSSML